MAKIYVHIGLPKTATTTLQSQIFSNFDENEIKYLGTYQPRNSNKNMLYEKFYRSVFTGKHIAETQLLLTEELKNNKNILISEEMITVSDWKVNLLNLKEILKPFNNELIISVRKHVRAMFSYYVQEFRNFSKLNLTFDEIARTNQKMKIFQYRIFLPT